MCIRDSHFASSTSPPNPSRRGVASNSKEIGAFTRSLVLPPIQQDSKPLSHNPSTSHHVTPQDTTTATAGASSRRTLAPMLSLIHISEPTRLLSISYAVFCLKKKNTNLYLLCLFYYYIIAYFCIR
eukprot:TRINITY_DN51493_c0_g1_i2.p1 TRINITY_DN51493_c0_g1~~TRINITY_DN51493_c0_g1_i2.p1  ORF type:complete len:126 (+),score=21.35 TRINITY_DN51493_c0_g1_i2:119-496(+)